MATSETESDPWSAEPPRQETDLYGDPVGKEQIGDEYWEVYTDADRPDRVFVAHYKWDGGWIKQGLDRHRPSELFNSDGWPTN